MATITLCDTLSIDPTLRDLSDTAFRIYITGIASSYRASTCKKIRPHFVYEGELRSHTNASTRMYNKAIAELRERGLLDDCANGTVYLVHWPWNREWADKDKAKKLRERRRKRRMIRRSLLLAALAQQGALSCKYCGCVLEPHATHVDHVKAISCGGLNALENLVLSCAPCNLAKGAKEVLP